MRTVPALLFVALVHVVALLGACGGSDKQGPPPMVPSDDDEQVFFAAAEEASPPAAATSSPEAGSGAVVDGTERGARTLLSQFADPKADHASLSRTLRPRAEDYRAIFDEVTAPKVEAAQAKDWEDGKIVVRPAHTKQTEISLWGATGAELASGSGNAARFPGGYRKLGGRLASGVTVYAFAFTEPGKSAGTTFDGLAFVNGRWVLAPKAWRALDGGGEAASPEPTAP